MPTEPEDACWVCHPGEDSGRDNEIISLFTINQHFTALCRFLRREFSQKKKRKQNPSLTGHIPPCVSSLQLWSSSPAPCCRWQTCECLDLSSSFYKTAAELSGLSLGWGRLEQGIHPSAQPWDLLPDPESVGMPPSGPGSLLLSFPCLLIQKSSVHDKSPVQGGLSPPSWVGADATPALCFPAVPFLSLSLLLHLGCQRS